METVNKIELHDENVFPKDEVLRGILGDSFSAYQELIQLYDANGLTHEWRYYHDGNAWLCKVQYKKKTVVWMSAWKGYMQATIYVPDKYIEQVYQLELSEVRKERIRGAKKMGKSTACIFEVRDAGVLVEFEKVMRLKMTLK
jgi:hypothetical protein